MPFFRCLVLSFHFLTKSAGAVPFVATYDPNGGPEGASPAGSQQNNVRPGSGAPNSKTVDLFSREAPFTRVAVFWEYDMAESRFKASNKNNLK